MQWPETSTGSDGGFEKCPTGSFAAKFYRIIDQGTQTDEVNGEVKVKREVMISWELSEKMSDGRPFTISAWYAQTLHEKSNLRKMLDGLNGGALTTEQVKNFSQPGAPKSLLGLQPGAPKGTLGLNCMLTITLNKNGKARVTSVAKRPSAMPPAEGVNERLYLSLDKADFDKAVFAKLGAGTRKKIAMSPEFQARLAEDPTLAALIVQAEDAAGAGQGHTPPPASDDDIPF